MMPFSRIALFALLSLAATLAAAQVQHGFYWSQTTGMIDLGTLGGTNSFATAINESGVVVGAAYAAGDTYLQAFKWTSSSGMQPLADFASGSFAFGINSLGQIVGSAGAVGGNHAVLWDTDGTIHDLGTLGGDTSWATGINDKGVITGDSYAQTGGLVAFVWSPFDGMQPLRGKVSDGNGVAREIVGDFVTRSGFYHAALWSLNFGRFDLGTLAPSQNANSFAQAVNLSNQVVGESEIFHNGPTHAFKYTTANGMVDLGTLGGKNSYAYAISPTGDAAGTAYLAGDTVRHAVIWKKVGGVIDLGTLGGTNSGVTGINLNREVAGTSDIP